MLLSLCSAAAFITGPGVPAPAHRLGASPRMDLTSLSARASYGGGQWDRRGLWMAPEPNDPPEIDPRRKDPNTPKPRPFVPLPMVGAGEDKMDVISRLLRDRILLLGQGVRRRAPAPRRAASSRTASRAGGRRGRQPARRAAALPRQRRRGQGASPAPRCRAQRARTDARLCARQDVTLYINSPGGSVSAGMAIFDTMQYVPCDINTVCFGTAASMGAFLLGAGSKGAPPCPSSRRRAAAAWAALDP